MTKTLANQVVDTLRDALSERTDFIPLHEPELGDAELANVTDCITTGWISTAGAYVGEFADKLAAATGTKYAAPTANGTAALHACFHMLGLGHGDEVLMPSLTFIATANSIFYTGAKPHFIDCDKDRLGVDAAKLDDYLEKIGRREDDGVRNIQTGGLIKALCIVHIFGHPCDMDPIQTVCDKWGLKIVEDAAEAVGSTYKGRLCGSLSDIAAVSFNGNKIITTGAGGGVISNDETLGPLAQHITTTAKRPHAYEFIHDYIGFNYRMPNICAALGVAQFDRLEGFIETKRKLFTVYEKLFADIDGVHMLKEPEDSRSNYWINALIMNKPDEETRDVILSKANDAGIMLRPIWRPMHMLDIYKDYPRMPDLSVTEYHNQTVINIPSNPKLLPLLT